MSAIEAAFIGALGRDAETKTSQNGKRYLRLNVRVGEPDVERRAPPASGTRRQPVGQRLMDLSLVFLDGSCALAKLVRRWLKGASLMPPGASEGDGQ